MFVISETSAHVADDGGSGARTTTKIANIIQKNRSKKKRDEEGRVKEEER